MSDLINGCTEIVHLYNDLKTMDSREIAELTAKRHDNVCRDIREQLGKLDGGVLKFEAAWTDIVTHQSYRYYKLPYRETMILVSGYSVELRARVIDRWMELERKEVSFAMPKTFPEALRLAADLEEQRALLAPKAAVYDKIASSVNLRLLSEVGKITGLGPNKIFTLLSERGVIFRQRGDWVPYEEYKSAGYFDVKESVYESGDGQTHTKKQLYATGKGELWIVRQFCKRASA